MEMLTFFEEIDRDCSGTITCDELDVYMVEKNYKSDFRNKWMTLFDTDGDNMISIEEFTEALGLIPREAYMEKVCANREQSGLMPSDDGLEIIQIADDFPDDIQDLVVKTSLDTLSDFTIESKIAMNIKKLMDDRDSPMWHVIVGKSQFGCKFSHLPRHFIHYKIDEHVFLLFKTPDTGN